MALLIKPYVSSSAQLLSVLSLLQILTVVAFSLKKGFNFSTCILVICPSHHFWNFVSLTTLSLSRIFNLTSESYIELLNVHLSFSRLCGGHEGAIVKNNIVSVSMELLLFCT